MTIKVQRYNHFSEPEDIRAWRKYADPINQRLAEKWKHGEPQDRSTVAAGINQRPPYPSHKTINPRPISARREV